MTRKTTTKMVNKVKLATEYTRLASITTCTVLRLEVVFPSDVEGIGDAAEAVVSLLDGVREIGCCEIVDQFPALGTFDEVSAVTLARAREHLNKQRSTS